MQPHRDYSTESNPRRIFGAALSALCTVLLTAATAVAQMAGGSITGTISDPSGAVVPSVSVTIMNRGTGIAHTLKSTSKGLFNQPNLDPGTYEITVEAPGFATAKTETLVDIGHDTVVEIKLRPGADTEVVNVSDSTPTIDLGSTQLNQTVDGKTLRELPLNGRDWTSLSTLEPNVHTVDNQLSISAGDNSRSNRGIGTQISIGGTRPAANNYRLDGVTTNDYSGAGPGGALGGTLGVDAIQEFTVITADTTPEYGRTYGGVVSAVTRQGTNQFHGSAYEFIRNSALDAHNYFTPAAAPFKRNQFGGSIGGPVLKQKAFFFFNYEGLRQSRTTGTPITVASPNAIKGYLVCTQTGTASNANCLTGIGGTKAAANTTGVQYTPIDPNVQPYLQIFTPPANAAVNGDTATYTFNSKAVAGENLFTGRVDYTFSPKDSLRVTGLNDGSSDTQPDGFNFITTGLDITRRLYSVQESHIFSPNVINTAHAGYSFTFAVAPAASAAINPLASDPSLGFAPTANVGEINIGGLSTFFGGVDAEGVYGYHYHSYQGGDDLFITHGAHSIQAGVSYERIQSNDVGRVTNGYFTFKSYTSFLTNAPTSFTSNIPGKGIPVYLRQNVFGGYVMDTYHVTKRLTLTGGVRYEPITPVSEKYGHLGLLLNPAADTQASIVSRLYNNPSLVNLSPRLGFALDPFGDGKTSVRGAFGIYDTLPLTYLFSLNTVTVAPFGSSANLSPAPAYSFGSYSNYIPHCTTSGANQTCSSQAFATAIANPTNKVTYVQQNFSRPYVEQYILNIQRQLISNVSLEVGYTGSHGVRQPIKSNDGNIVAPMSGANTNNMLWPALVLNSKGTYVTSGTKLNTHVGSIDMTTFNTPTSYNALNVALRGNGKNYRLGIAYTWSKSLDDASSSNGGTNFTNSLIAPFNNIPSRFWGLSDFNVAQNLSVNALYMLKGVHSSNSFVREATSGFQAGGILRIATGLPFTPLISGDPLGLSSANTFSLPDRLYGPGCKGNPTDLSQKNTSNFLKRQCFAYPLPVNINGQYYPRLGNLARNSIIGPGITTMDFSLVKNTAVRALGDAGRVELRAEAFNVFNHPNFQVPARANSVVYSAPTLTTTASPGTTSGAATNLPLLTATSTTERQIQFGLKIIF